MSNSVSEKYSFKDKTISEKDCQYIICPAIPSYNWEYNLESIFKEVNFKSIYHYQDLKKEELVFKLIELKDAFTYSDSFRIQLKSHYISEINKLITKFKYSKAIEIYEYYFGLNIEYSSTEYSNYLKIIKLYNKLNPKKNIIPKEYPKQETEIYKILKSNIKHVKKIDSTKCSKDLQEKISDNEIVFKKTFFLPNRTLYLNSRFENNKINFNSYKFEIKKIAIDEFKKRKIILDKKGFIYLIDEDNTILNELQLNTIINDYEIYDNQSISISTTHETIIFTKN